MGMSDPPEGMSATVAEGIGRDRIIKWKMGDLDRVGDAHIIMPVKSGLPA